MVALGSLPLGGGIPRIAVVLTDSFAPSSVLEAHRHGVALAEMRVDLFRRRDAASIAATLSSLGTLPRIGTVRLRAEGGAWTGSEDERLELFQTILPHVDAVDIELQAHETLARLRPLVTARGATLIVSHHAYAATPSLAELQRLVAEAESAGADIVKIATMIPTGAPEALRALNDLTRLLVLHPRSNLIVIGMGPAGLISRVAFPRLGSLVTFASYGPEGSTAPGQMPWETMVGLFRVLSPEVT